jgi:hypothetical protein
LVFWDWLTAMKKNEILSFAGKWMELENIIVSEVSQAQKTQTTFDGIPDCSLEERAIPSCCFCMGAKDVLEK